MSSLKKMTMLAVLGSAAAGVSAGALAQQGLQNRPAAPGGQGFYLGLGAGTADFKGPNDKESAWKLFGGYNFNNNFGVEAGYHDLGSPPGGSTTAWELSGVGRLPLGDRFGLFGKIGGYRLDDRPAGGGDRSDWTWGLGASYDFTRNWSARLEWQQFRDVGFGGNDVNSLTLSGAYRF